MAEPKTKKRRGPYGRRNYDTELEFPKMLIQESLEETTSEPDIHSCIQDSMKSCENNFDNSRNEPSESMATVTGFDMDEATMLSFDDDNGTDEVLPCSIDEEKNCFDDDLTLDTDDEDVFVEQESYCFTEENIKEGLDSDTMPLYPGAAVSVGAFMLLLAIFTTKHNLVGDAIQQLLNILAFALPNGHNLCTKLNQFKKYFLNLKNPLIFHYYCSYCQGLIENSSVKKCPYDHCQKPFDKQTASYFLEISVKNQIETLFAKEEFCKNIKHRFNRTSKSGSYSDIYDGKLYKSLFDNKGFLSNPYNLSFTFNTDGAPVFKSSKVSVWPIFLVVNELPYHLRMLKENMILASLWFGSQKPTMGTFLKPFKRCMEEYYHTGILCKSPEEGTVLSKGILLCGTADLPARSLLCNHIQYNGAFSCWKCEQRGTTHAVGKGHAHVFPFDKTNPKGPERNVANILENAKSATENQKSGKSSENTVKGIKGPSWLLFFPKFDIVCGIAIDYMHGVLLGVQKLMLELWFLQKYAKKEFNIYNKICLVDERLLNLRPTLDISRLPRSILDMKYWKASEYRSFLLYFGAPVLHGILDAERFSHFLLIVNAIHILLKCGSSDDEVDQAELMLIKFCEQFGKLYGTCFMRLNVHQLLHLPDCVRNLGPLYTHSCFAFEDKNGVILKMIRGTQNIDHQIVTGVSFVQKLPELREKCIVKGSECEQLYQSIEFPTLLKRTSRIDNGVYVLGKIKEKTLSEEEMLALTKYLDYYPMTYDFNSFSRLDFHNNLIYGLVYTRMVKRDNSTIQYIHNDKIFFGQVRFFIIINDNNEKQVLAFIEKLKCEKFGEDKHILAVTKTKELDVLKIQNIVSSCMLLSYSGSKTLYLCKFPNRMESD